MDNAEPKAEIRKRIPIQVNVFFLPRLLVGYAPNKAPNTVPHKAIDIMKKPWKKGLVDHNSLVGKLAPEITTVSKPNKKPDNPATRIHKYDLGMFIQLRVRTHLKQIYRIQLIILLR